MSTPTILEKSIFATVAYYDYFNYPLTAVEIYYYLIKFDIKDVIASEAKQSRDNKEKREIASSSFSSFRSFKTSRNDSENPAFLDIIEILDNSENLKKFIGRKNGFYFLAGREEIIKQRIQKKKLTDQKFKKTKWILRFISYLPFVRLIMLSGSTGMGNPYKESDIDLLIVAVYGRIWTTRAILTFFTLLFGAYRHTGKTENRLCFNHYITDKSLGVNFGNLYKTQEYLNLLPLAGDLDIYKKFFKENAWIKDYAHSYSGSLEKNLREIPLRGAALKIKHFFEFLLSGLTGDCLEKYLKKFQIFFIEKNPLTKSPDARIRYDDRSLVFHPVLIEPEVIGRWKEKMAEFNIKMS